MNLTQTQINYHGSELKLFAEATKWKAYWSECLRQYAVGTVLEVGAGLGGSTPYICLHSRVDRCICLEPDPSFSAHLLKMRENGSLPDYCEIKCGIVSDLPSNVQANAIFYIDVLEHIENDVEEVGAAASHLVTSGRLIVLSPALQWLYSPFDKSIGHHRRYSRKDIKRLTVSGLEIERVFFLDSLGMLLSMINRLFLRAVIPTASQIRFWDQNVIPLSRYLDRAFGAVAGRSIVMVWRKE